MRAAGGATRRTSAAAATGPGVLRARSALRALPIRPTRTARTDRVARVARTARVRRLVRCAVALGVLLAVGACGGGSGGHGEVTVMVPWSGDEFQAFYAAVKRFEGDTGITVDVEITRAQTQQLDAAVAAGAPPDLAMLPSVGAIDRYANTGSPETRLRPLDPAMTKDYAQPFRGLGTVGGKVYAVPVKADVKSLLWYDPAVTTSRPRDTLADLAALSGPSSRTWCLGLASGPTSGWPGADWIADILLEQDSTDYANWVAGALPGGWQSPRISRAWTTWQSLVKGSLRSAAEQDFAGAAAGMFTSPATCSLAHGALGAIGFPATADPKKPYDFVAPDRGRPLEVSADFVGRFTDNPAATKLIAWLSSADGQRAWVGAARSFAISADSRVSAADYRTPAQSQVAAMLRPHSGRTLCFSAADAMQPDVSAAFYRAVLDYATGAQVGDLLKGLDAVQHAQRQGPPVPPGNLCASPG